ncbi:hypothetical protein PTKIN_Ptkin02bG0107000 [Pterospermum kingtungense]
MDHEWVKTKSRLSPEYMEGIDEFLNVAKRGLNTKGETLCPCTKCFNTRWHNIDVIRAHLLRVGIDRAYTRWVYHGEKELDDICFGDDDFVNEDDGLRSGLHDAIGGQYFNIGSTDDLTRNQRTTVEEARYDKLYEALNKPLFAGCKNLALEFVLKLMNIKVINKWSDNSFEMLLKLLHEMLMVMLMVNQSISNFVTSFFMLDFITSMLMLFCNINLLLHY